MPVAAAPAGFVEVQVDESAQALSSIDHVVVLMMENRSFDHMLGYLKLESDRADVDGLTRTMSSTYEGKTYRPRRAAGTSLLDSQDPCHSGECVDEQLGAVGFVGNYVKTRTDPVAARNPGLVMTYHNAAHLPVYDFLTGRYCVCDRWFSSVPGATFPNRLYAAAGRAAGSRDNASPPTYDVPAFVRHLDRAKVSWHWYTHEVFATILAIDRSYVLHSIRQLRPFSSGVTSEDFISAAARGALPSVSWIDPNFVDTGGAAGSNDDHPPSDLRAGQQLVLRVLTALAKSPLWAKTLLIVVYDEHGGFFDHVQPPAAPDDSPDFRRYGVRVPSLLVSARVGVRVSHELFDHTSILKTILLRFCLRNGRYIPNMGTRVTEANHLGSALGRGQPSAPPKESELAELARKLAEWRAESLVVRTKLDAPSIAPEPSALTDFQEDYLEARDAVLGSLTPRERNALAAQVAAVSLSP
jgi:phospholipase C